MNTTAYEDLAEQQTALSANAGSRALYFALAADPQSARPAAEDYLRRQLAAAAELPADLPSDLHALEGWMEQRTDHVGEQYKAYLAARKAGAPRRYFPSRSAALAFLRAVAPTKLVDGSWLYGLLRQWDNPDFHALIRTYLEELGDGVPDKNHVVIYRKLLATHGCEQWETLSDHHFVQGALQLALAHCADSFLPEVIGFNLGYEQLPLHLLITSYELNELGIDPYYFTLHVTVDNAANGHAKKAVQALRQLMPQVGDSARFMQRVLDGYRLNDLGASTTSVIASFDLEHELVDIMSAKAVVGKNMHSDYCRVAGRSVNDWLAQPAQIPDFLRSLEASGWIKRGEPVENSRFWKLVQGERAQMFGVFNAYEQQVLRDWICSTPGEGPARTHRAMQRSLESLAPHRQRQDSGIPRGLIRHHATEPAARNELHELEEQVASLGSKDEVMALLASLMSPTTHHTAVGLMATRMFSRLLDA
ncbi:iron-containing redox enzyme family protein [Massilia arenosa]|uniref:Iron-containing redox enzyme family protein n=1 Tax=Zemynaea arenosa TaxID=2561931 RepID=A0A4Y9RR04_9BURK|nr:iron-containing redox enzyme family protein [Massilia arenosa]TFW11323.1 iron-containing redox enzyme family protein [Massilia arenosa]